MSYQRIIDFSNHGEARFYVDEAKGKNYACLRAPESMPATYELQLPQKLPTVESVLECTPAGLMQFAPIVGLGSVHVREEQLITVDGGGFQSGAWRTRILNVIHSDLGGLASLAANRVTLQRGVWECSIACPAFRVGRHQARLQNIDDATTTLIGTSERAGDASVVNKSLIIGIFSISVATVFEIQHQCATNRPADGLGSSANFTTEVYTVATFRRIDDA